jgi:hypothetical protein
MLPSTLTVVSPEFIKRQIRKKNGNPSDRLRTLEIVVFEIESISNLVVSIRLNAYGLIGLKNPKNWRMEDKVLKKTFIMLNRKLILSIIIG